MHELWSNVRLPAIISKYRQEVIDTWLSRSGQHPLVLDIRQVTPDLHQFLSQYSPRIRTLTLGHFTVFDGSMDVLETLQLMMTGWQEVFEASLAFLGATRLRSVVLSGFHPKFTHRWDNIGIQWQQLTYLSVNKFVALSPSHGYHILGLCTSLITASLPIYEHGSYTTFPTDQTLLMSSLQTLVLYSLGLYPLSKFLNLLALPSLVDLELVLQGIGPSRIYHVTTFPALRRLSIRDICRKCADVELDPWLVACPSAVDVWLSPAFISNPILSRIAINTPEGRKALHIQRRQDDFACDIGGAPQPPLFHHH
jgi:hypothetical protein